MPTVLNATPPRPPFWFRLSIVTANLLQLAGLIAGAAILYLDAHLQAADVVRVVLMLLGWLIIYICCHAFAHWLIGRLVGIEFQGYGLRGTDHPENYSGVIRSIMNVMPMFTVITKKGSMQKAQPIPKALMFAAGETSTAVCTILASWYAWQRNIPGGFILFVGMIGFNAISTVSTARIPRGDYNKAWHALHTLPKNAEET